MNERTHFFIKIYLSHFILERVDGCVWEVSWRQGPTAILTQVLLTIASFLSHLGWVAQPWVTEGPKPSVCKLVLTLASSLQLTRTVWALGYIIVSRTPASAVLPLIYTGASLDWRLGRGSIYNRRILKEILQQWGASTNKKIICHVDFLRKFIQPFRTSKVWHKVNF